MKPAVRILVVAGACVAALCALVVRETIERARGEEVLLPMEAVDPRALLSGHYVIVALRETVPVGSACPPGTDTLPSKDQWIALAPRDGRHGVAGAATTREGAKALGPIQVRGMIICDAPFTPVGGEPSAGWISFDVGVDRFHIDQAQAERIESLMRRSEPGEGGQVLAIVSAGRDGRARLKGLIAEGERLELKLL